MTSHAFADSMGLPKAPVLLDGQLRLIIEQSPGAIAIFDLNSCCLLASRRWQQAYGLDGESVVGQSYTELFPRMGDRWQLLHRQCLAEATDLEGEDLFQRADGTTGWLRWQMRPWRNQGGAIGGVIHISEEVTAAKQLERARQTAEAERQQAAEMLRQREERYRSLVIATSQFVWIADATGQMISRQDMQAYTGQTEAEARGWGWLEVIHPDDRQRTAQAWTHAVETQSLYDTEYRLRILDGSYRYYCARGVPILNADGSVREWIGVYSDIHDRKTLEKQLALQQSRFNAFFSAANAGLAILDDQLRYVHVNEVLAEVDGLAIADHLGRTISEVLPDLGPSVEPVIQRVFNTGKPLLNVEVSGETLTCPGVVRHWLNSYFALPGEDGKPMGVGAVIMEITDRKRVEQELQESQRRLSTLMSNLPGMAYRCCNDHEWTTEFASSGCLELTGYPPEALINSRQITYEEITHPDDREIVRMQIEAGLQSNKPYQMVYRIITASGQERWVWEQGRGVGSLDGGLVAMEGFITNITDRRQIEQSLQESQRRLSTLMSNLPGMAYRCRNDHDWKQEFVSGGCFELTGYPAESLINNREISYEQIIHPEDRDIVWEQVQAALQVNCSFQLTYRIITAAGQEKWVWEQGLGILSAEGEVLALEGFIADITERKQAEVQLRAKAQREQLLNRLTRQIRSSLDLNQILETAVQSIRDLLQVDRCIFIWYRSGAEVPYWEIVQEANQPVLPSLVGFQIPSVEILPIAEKALNKEAILLNDVDAVVDPTTRQYFESRGYTALLSMPVHTQSGEIGVVNCCQVSSSRIWHNDEVELLRAVADNLAIAIDQAELYKQSRMAAVTAQVQAQRLEATLQELQQTQAQMVQSEKMSSLGQLVAGVAHEINNPVNFISGNLAFANNYTRDLLRLLQVYRQSYPQPVAAVQAEAEAIDFDFLVEDLPKLLTSMRVGAERIQSIVASLRSFSRMDEAEMKAVNIHDGIDSTLMILQSRLKAKPGQPDIRVVKDYGDLPLVECYVGQLNQVFMNLLTNAIDAIESRIEKDAAAGRQENLGMIRIRTLLDHTEHVQICIADNGEGVAAQLEQRLFDPFFTTKPVGQGTGLGLSISYQIVTQKHRGQLQYVSAPGEGTEFKVTIPLHQL